MGNKIITIAREYGCGGRLIAKKLADRLGFDYYDSDLISLAAEKTGMTEAYIKEIEQKKVSNFLYTLFLSGQSLTLADQVFIAQAEIIRAAAEKNSSVFVGRCADYILKDFPDCVNLFLYAPADVRIRRVCEEYRESDPAQAELYIARKDKERASYYNYFSTNTWGNYKNYDLCIDCQIGVDATVDLIADFMKLKFPQ